MTRGTKRRAATLVEVVLVTGILGLFLVMVGHALILSQRATTRSRLTIEDTRQALNLLEQMTRELRTCNQLLSPSSIPPYINNELGLAAPQVPLIFRRMTGTGSVVVAFWRDGELARRSLYDSASFDLGQPGSWMLKPGEQPAGRIMARNVETMQLQVIDPAMRNGQRMVSLLVKTRSLKQALTKEVRVLSF